MRHEARQPAVAQQVVLRDPGESFDIGGEPEVGDGHVAWEICVGELPESFGRS